MAISNMEKEMYYSAGHKLKITLKDGTEYECKCIGYTSSIDNEPDPAEIDIAISGRSGLVSISEPEIKKLTIKD